MRKVVAKKFDWFLVAALVGFGVLGILADRAVIQFTPKKQCAEIAVTGTPGVSRMSVDGNDLFLTGVTAVRCGADQRFKGEGPGF